MVKNRKLLITVLSLTGLGCLFISAILLFFVIIPGTKPAVPTPLVISSTKIPIKPPSQNALSNQGKRTIPFQSVVLITALYYENGRLEQQWTGSGTIISKDGLILTNAHVVLPVDNYPVDMLTIAPTVSADVKPDPGYIAKVIQADSALDIAVLKIVSDLSGNPVDAATLDLPVVKLGDSDKLALGDKISILGYPGIGGETITLTSGEVAGFTAEAGYGNRAFIKTSAAIAGGNSGGLAANDAGELVGIPTQLGSGGDSGIVDCRLLADTNGDGYIDEDDTCIPTGGFINSLRPINLARPLIEAAQRGEVNVINNAARPQRQSPQSSGVLYTDDFSNPSSGWTIETDTDGSVGYANGRYIIQVSSPNTILSGTSGYAINDMVMTITAQVIQSTGKGDFGMICRQQADKSYYAFEIREDGYASIWKNYSDNIIPLVDWEYIPEIAGKMPINLTVACVGNQLGLGVDGILLISAVDNDFSSGDTGLLAGTWNTGGLVVAFDNFVVKTPK